MLGESVSQILGIVFEFVVDTGTQQQPMHAMNAFSVWPGLGIFY